MLILFSSSLSAQRSGSNSIKLLDPIGTWDCIVYGAPALGDENYIFSFSNDYSIMASKNIVNEDRVWQNISPWEVNDTEILFSDQRMGRNFRGNLTRFNLGGDWRTSNSVGGWWCTRSDEEVDRKVYNDISSFQGRIIVPLIPEIIITPAYPRQAHREALEGSAVICFEVLPNGEIYNPEFLELSDEIFRASSLDALMSTKFKPWGHLVELERRPACRSYLYRLDYAY